MPFCVECGAEHPPAARFCPSCGRPVNGAEARTEHAQTRKVVTVLFADIVGSTALGEHHDAETVQALLAQYFQAAAAILRRHGGTVEKFIGDAVVAVFGVPETHEDDALRAVRAAVEFRSAATAMRFDSTQGAAPLQVRIGVNSGEVVVGDPTTGQSFSVGDAMNTAARLQSAAAPGQILIGDLTHRLAGDAVTVEGAGALALKGKQDAVPAWAVLDVAEHGSGPTRRLDAPLVGRQAELSQLQELLRSVAETRECRLVTLLGEAGVGKSKLAYDFVAGAGANALHGRCLSYGEGVTFWPLVEVLRGALDSEDSAGTELAEEVQTFLAADDAAEQVTERLLEILYGGGTSSTQELFWAVRRFLEAAADPGPLVLVVDDIHWAEPTFLDLLEYLAVWTRAPLLIVCTARPDLLKDIPEWSHAQHVEIVEVSPLDGGQAHELVTALAGGLSVTPDVARRIAEASEGNPLYVEEMVRMLADEAGAAPGELAAPLEDRIPPTVQALIAARLDRLEGPARAPLQRASVVGTEFTTPAVVALGDGAGGEETSAVALRTLVHREFVVPQPAAGDQAYRFAHGLIRDVAYGATPKRERGQLHARFAAWLQQRADTGTELDEILGHHLGQAAALRLELGLLDDQTRELARQACSLLTQAGRRALARSDMPAAAKLLRRAASLSLDDEVTAAQLRLELCDALIEMGELDDATALVPAIRTVATTLGDERLAARADVMQAMVDMNLDAGLDPDAMAATFDRVLSVLSAAEDYVGCSQAHQVLADAAWNASSFEGAQVQLESALAFANRAGDARERGRIVTWLASSLLWGPADAQEAIDRCEQILAEAGGDLLVAGKTTMILAGLFAYRGRFDEARAAFAHSRSIVEDLGLSLTLASGTQVSGMIEMLAGDPVTAETEFRRGYDALVAMGQKGYLPAAAAFLAGALVAQGRLDEAEALADELRESADPDDDAAQGDYASLASRLAVARRRSEEAVAHARTAVAAYAETDELKSHADALHVLAVALASAGRSADARQAAEHARRLYELKGITPSVQALDALVASLDTGQPAT